MGKKHSGRNTEFAKFRRTMARLEVMLENQKKENVLKGKEGGEK